MVRALDFYPGGPGSNPIWDVGFFQAMHHFLVTNFHIRKNKNKQINQDKHPDESKTRTHRFSKLPDDGDPWAPNNILTPKQKKKHQLDPGGPGNSQEAPGPNQLKLAALSRGHHRV